MMKSLDLTKRGRPPLKATLLVVVPYMVFAFIWIFLSDTALARVAPTVSHYRRFEVIKGFMFVVVSGILLFLLLYKLLREHAVAQGERADLLVREQAARARVETANRAKDELLGLVSHELRTPLTAILTSTDLLDIETSLSDDQRELIATIRESVMEESRIVGDLLDATSMAAGKLDVRLEAMDIQTALAAAIADLRATVADKRIELRLDSQAVRSDILGDRTRMVQVLRNLLGNAIKFTPRDGVVIVRTHSDGKSVEIAISDTGIGIGENVRQRLFEPFEQGDRSVARNYGGLGLGLYLARSIIELHGGTVEVQSEGAGHGSIFTVSLPLASEAGAATSSGLHGCSILLVEDNVDTLKLMTRLVRRIGCKVLPARSAEEALKVADENGVDLLISDIGLPDRTGWDLMRELQQKHPTPGIAISGYVSQEDQARSLEAGFSVHLVKPISFVALHLAVTEILCAAHANRFAKISHKP